MEQAKNLADYEWFHCTDSSDCKLNPVFTMKQDELNEYFKDVPDNSPVLVIQGYAIYIVAPLFLAVLFIMYVCMFCWCRKCCCCIKGGSCGRRYPTQKSCCFGYKKKPEKNGEYKYSCFGRWCAKLYMGMFVAIVFGAIFLCYVKGSVGITDSFKAVAQSPQSVVKTAVMGLPVIENLLVGVIGSTIVTFVDKTNDTIAGALNPGFLLDRLECVDNTLDALSLQPIFDSLDLAQKGFDVLDSPALNDNVVKGQINNLIYVKGNFSVILPRLSGNLGVLQAGITGISSEASNIVSQLTTSQDLINSVAAFVAPLKDNFTSA
jgi:hypothetical protein